MKSYDDMDDDVNGQGCLQPVMVMVIVIGIICALASCGTTKKPSYEATITNAKGKMVARINGTYDPATSPLERFMGPAGVLLGSIFGAFQLLIPVPVP